MKSTEKDVSAGSGVPAVSYAERRIAESEGLRSELFAPGRFMGLGIERIYAGRDSADSTDNAVCIDADRTRWGQDGLAGPTQRPGVPGREYVVASSYAFS